MKKEEEQSSKQAKEDKDRKYQEIKREVTQDERKRNKKGKRRIGIRK